MGVSQSSVSGRVQNFFIGPELDNRRHPHNTKKTGKLQTLRKKVLRVKRSSRSFDYGKAVKELTNGWATKNIQELLNVFNSLKELKEVTLLAQSARPSSSSLRDDLENLYNRKYCADVQFMYDGEIFSAHRSILSSRCQYFRNLFSKYKRIDGPITIDIRTPGVDAVLFGDLLRFLYTQYLDIGNDCSRPVIEKLKHEFGMPNRLEDDLRALLTRDIKDYDCVLVFSTSNYLNSLGDARSDIEEYRCHKALLASRSPFFRNVLEKRRRNYPEIIQLDEAVIPRIYARTILHAIYTDILDTTLIPNIPQSSLADANALANSERSNLPTHVRHAIDLYQIARFIEFGKMAENCENLIWQAVNVETCCEIINWARMKHGSKWVLRQCEVFVQEEFSQLVHSGIWLDLDEETVKNVLTSDFLQASEGEILSSVIKWGEQQLIKRIEEREPNLLNHTTHSVSKKGVKRRDLDDTELKSIISEHLSLVRYNFITSSDMETLLAADKRGLVMPSSCQGVDLLNYSTGKGWIDLLQHPEHRRYPRCFQPYIDELLAVLEEKMTEDDWNVNSVSVTSNSTFNKPDIVSDTMPLPGETTLNRMERRLKQIEANHRLYYTHSNFINAECLRQFELRVVREFGLPDSSVDLLKSQSVSTPPLTQNKYAVPRSNPLQATKSSEAPCNSEELPDVARLNVNRTNDLEFVGTPSYYF